jgi:putative glutamine amidotransferase
VGSLSKENVHSFSNLTETILERIILKFASKIPSVMIYKKGYVPAILIIAVIILSMSCNQTKPEPLKIAVTKATKNYLNWLHKGDSALVPVDMYTLDLDTALAALVQCHGLLVTGGEDLQPEYYGKGAERDLCKETDPRRDTLEMALIRKALELNMPVLGICRGEQAINVALGGTLIVDIPSHFKDLPRINHVVHQCENYLNCHHQVHILESTLLSSITGCDTGFVNTNHHQAVEVIAPGLVCNARSFDGITEGIEWEVPAGKPFLLGIQWHPERMDTSNSLSGRVLAEFILKSREFKEKK